MVPNSNEIRIESTTLCNYNCVICPRELLTRKKETMSLELFIFLFRKIIKEKRNYDTLTFPGMGEPLLDNTIDDKIRYAKKKAFRVLILVNGSTLTPERFLALEKIGVDSIRISMYGDSPACYNAVHGVKDKHAFERIKKNVTEICRIKGKTQILMTYNVVEGYNEEDTARWIEYWKDKADLIEVWRPHNWVDAKKYREVKRLKLKTCGRPFNTPLQVQVDGTVNMCCFDFDGKLLLGDLKKQTLEEIFSSPAFEKIRQCHLTGRFQNSGLICAYCDQRNRDKKDVMIYNSKFKTEERVNLLSTTYGKIFLNTSKPR